MIPELGNFALTIALVIALVQLVVPLVGVAKNNTALMAMARPAAQGQFVFSAIAFGCLVAVMVGNDFSVKYAIMHSNSMLPTLYQVSAVWGGHEGSMLLWILMLTGWGLAVSVFSRRLPIDMVARVLAVLGFVSIGFMLFTLITSNPFDRVMPPAPDGRDLNPLLQDPGLAIHPPLLYMGYVGFSVAFAFAIAALMSGKMDATWARWSRPWTTIAWVFLTLGIALGSWWAYYELGWGGWWFWDPVENASFMPWLVGTALVHSLAATEKRGSFKNWTVLLAIFAFSLSLLGTFLVRSGVLTSVHSFASDPQRGMAILIFLTIVIGGSLLLYAWRAPKVGLGGNFALVSRESLLLVNNVLLVVAAGAVLLGTLYPLLLDALGQGKMSVGPPYFNAVFVPLMAPLVFFMGVGPIARWKKAEIPDLVTRLKWSAGVAVVTGVLGPFIMGEWTAMRALGILMAAWIISTVVENIVNRIRQQSKAGVQLGKMSLSYYGMQTAHFGVAIFIIGVTMVNGYEVEKDVRMDLGDVVTIGDYQFRFDGTREVKGPNYIAEQGIITVLKNDQIESVLHPEKRYYNVQQQVMTEAGIDTGLFRDLYVSLGEPAGNSGAWSVRAYYKPFVDWIWAGCAIMGIGGILAISDRRYRIVSRREKEIMAKNKELESGAKAKPSEAEA
ncbi:MAG: heme lyase CcmF/NrfE family subunit [Gammaproteobacteria bacterium]|nr:heme lyase CcmF/NrfE family subunit [Gammaproteobacteria bacterium]MDH5730892.1 heme lyase CcmF/NrfE family subunit [Gammaproteobacteria bacterium]